MKIILFRGRPGSGKTTLSHAFAEKTHLPILRKDDFYDPISNYIEGHQKRNTLSHEILYTILESNVHTDTTFILDFAFQTPTDYSLIKNWCLKREVEFKSILVTCSDEKVWAERFNKRSENPLPNQLITNFDELKKHYGTMEVELEENELMVDTVDSIEVLIQKVEKFIQ